MVHPATKTIGRLAGWWASTRDVPVRGWRARGNLRRRTWICPVGVLQSALLRIQSRQTCRSRPARPSREVRPLRKTLPRGRHSATTPHARRRWCCCTAGSPLRSGAARQLSLTELPRKLWHAYEHYCAGPSARRLQPRPRAAAPRLRPCQSLLTGGVWFELVSIWLSLEFFDQD